MALDTKGAELLREMVAEVGSVEETVQTTASHGIAGIMGTIQQGDMMAEIFGPDSSSMIADMMMPQLQAQGLALILAGAFLMESFPAEMEEYMQGIVAAAEEAEADQAAVEASEGL